MTDHNPTSQPQADDLYEESSWLYDHIGRISGIILGILTLAALGFLAAIGSQAALGILVVFLFGVVVIAVGTQLRGPGH